jgi:predicted secreted protein
VGKKKIAILMGILMLSSLGASSAAVILGVSGSINQNPMGNDVDLKNSVIIADMVKEKLGIDNYVFLVDANLTEDDKKDSSLIILFYGGPLANKVTRQLVADGKSKIDWSNSKGDFEIITQAFGNKSATAIIIAGKDRDSTKTAYQNFANYLKENITVMSEIVSKQFNITLVSNPSTGYAWQAIYDVKVLKLEKNTFIPSTSGLIGAPGKEIFTFNPIETGKTIIIMNYQRPWEHKTIGVNSKIFVLSINSIV